MIIEPNIQHTVDTKNAMHSTELSSEDASMRNRRNSPVHDPERLPSIPDRQVANLETIGRYYSISMG